MVFARWKTEMNYNTRYKVCIEKKGTIGGATTVLPGRCTRSLVLTVDRKPKFRSNLMVRDQFTVRSATENIGHGDFNRKNARKNSRNSILFFLFYFYGNVGFTFSLIPFGS